MLAEARRRGLVARIRVGQGDEHSIGDVICLAPPFVILEAQVDRMVAILREAISAYP